MNTAHIYTVCAHTSTFVILRILHAAKMLFGFSKLGSLAEHHSKELTSKRKLQEPVQKWARPNSDQHWLLFSSLSFYLHVISKRRSGLHRVRTHIYYLWWYESCMQPKCSSVSANSDPSRRIAVKNSIRNTTYRNWCKSAQGQIVTNIGYYLRRCLLIQTRPLVILSIRNQ